jgi:hypothetical protein
VQTENNDDMVLIACHGHLVLLFFFTSAVRYPPKYSLSEATVLFLKRNDSASYGRRVWRKKKKTLPSITFLNQPIRSWSVQQPKPQPPGVTTTTAVPRATRRRHGIIWMEIDASLTPIIVLFHVGQQVIASHDVLHHGNVLLL